MQASHCHSFSESGQPGEVTRGVVQVRSSSSDLRALDYALDLTDCAPLPPYVRERVPICSLSEASFWLFRNGASEGINSGHFCIEQ